MEGVLADVSPAAASAFGVVGAALVTGLFGVAFLLLRRRTEREQLNSLVISQAVQMAKEHRTEHAEDVGTIAGLRDQIRGLERDLAALEARAEHAEQELRAREASDVLTHQVIDRLQAENADLKRRVGE